MEELIRALEWKLRTREDAREAASNYKVVLNEWNKDNFVMADSENFVYVSADGDHYFVEVDEDGIRYITPIPVFGGKQAA